MDRLLWSTRMERSSCRSWGWSFSTHNSRRLWVLYCFCGKSIECSLIFLFVSKVVREVMTFASIQLQFGMRSRRTNLLIPTTRSSRPRSCFPCLSEQVKRIGGLKLVRFSHPPFVFLIISRHALRCERLYERPCFSCWGRVFGWACTQQLDSKSSYWETEGEDSFVCLNSFDCTLLFRFSPRKPVYGTCFSLPSVSWLTSNTLVWRKWWVRFIGHLKFSIALHQTLEIWR